MTGGNFYLTCYSTYQFWLIISLQFLYEFWTLKNFQNKNAQCWEYKIYGIVFKNLIFWIQIDNKYVYNSWKFQKDWLSQKVAKNRQSWTNFADFLTVFNMIFLKISWLDLLNSKTVQFPSVLACKLFVFKLLVKIHETNNIKSMLNALWSICSMLCKWTVYLNICFNYLWYSYCNCPKKISYDCYP